MKIIINIPGVPSLPDGLTKEELLSVIQESVGTVISDYEAGRPNELQKEKQVNSLLSGATISLYDAIAELLDPPPEHDNASGHRRRRARLARALSEDLAPGWPPPTGAAILSAAWLLGILHRDCHTTPPTKVHATVDSGVMLHFEAENQPCALFDVHPDGDIVAATSGTAISTWDVTTAEEVAASVRKFQTFMACP